MGLMLTSLLVAQGRTVTVAERHPDRREQAIALGARAATAELGRHELVFEAVGRPETWRAAISAALPGGVVVLVGGCPSGTEVSLPPGAIHYDELDLRGTFHHSYSEVDEALALLAAGRLDWRALAGDTIALEELPGALAAPAGGPARKWVVDPRA
jgi:L-iditol 2-dehydrogenase